MPILATLRWLPTLYSAIDFEDFEDFEFAE
jgi:hypothetical protein